MTFTKTLSSMLGSIGSGLPTEGSNIFGLVPWTDAPAKNPMDGLMMYEEKPKLKSDGTPETDEKGDPVFETGRRKWCMAPPASETGPVTAYTAMSNPLGFQPGTLGDKPKSWFGERSLRDLILPAYMVSTIGVNAASMFPSITDSISSAANSVWSYASENPTLTGLSVGALGLGMLATQTDWFSSVKNSVRDSAKGTKSQVDSAVNNLREKAADGLDPRQSHLPGGPLAE